MNKSDKELAVELTVALINANPRMNERFPNGSEKPVPGITLEGVKNCLKGFYETLESFDNKCVKE